MSFPKIISGRMVVQPGQDWNGDYDTGALHHPPQGRTLVQCQVRADLIVVRCISRKNLPQVRSPKTSIWSKQSRRTVPIRRSTYAFCHGDPGEIGNRSIADAHGPHPGPEDMSVGTVRRR